MAPPILSLRDVTVRYPAARRDALSRANVALGEGELVVILGPNGAGKSTLLRALAGRVVPTDGEASAFGEAHRLLDRGGLARKLAVVEPNEDVAFGYRVRDVVAMGRAPHQGAWMVPRPEDDAVVAGALATCELEEFADREVESLSYGEKKRVAIARALAQEPRVLLLDEPSAFLDVRHELLLYDVLTAHVAGGPGRACLVVMHDLNVAAQYASRVVLMKGGAIVADGTVEQVMTYQLLKETFDADLYCGVNDLTGARFFLPMRKKA